MSCAANLGLPKGENPLFDAKHSPHLVLALFSRVLGRGAERLAAHDADYRILLLRRRCRQRGVAAEILRNF